MTRRYTEISTAGFTREQMQTYRVPSALIPKLISQLGYNDAAHLMRVLDSNSNEVIFGAIWNVIFEASSEHFAEASKQWVDDFSPMMEKSKKQNLTLAGVKLQWNRSGDLTLAARNRCYSKERKQWETSTSHYKLGGRKVYDLLLTFKMKNVGQLFVALPDQNSSFWRELANYFKDNDKQAKN
jgi:hypothetical protein